LSYICPYHNLTSLLTSCLTRRRHESQLRLLDHVRRQKRCRPGRGGGGRSTARREHICRQWQMIQAQCRQAGRGSKFCKGRPVVVLLGPVCFGFWQLLATKSCCEAKLSAFQPASIKFVGAKTIQNQHKHIIC
jgi:hypothetical protein